jgi:hypothetical protein
VLGRLSRESGKALQVLCSIAQGYAVAEEQEGEPS